MPALFSAALWDEENAGAGLTGHWYCVYKYFLELFTQFLSTYRERDSGCQNKEENEKYRMTQSAGCFWISCIGMGFIWSGIKINFWPTWMMVDPGPLIQCFTLFNTQSTPSYSVLFVFHLKKLIKEFRELNLRPGKIYGTNYEWTSNLNFGKIK